MAFSPDIHSRDPDRSSRLVRPSAGVRRRALVRLYERRSTVNNLIGALERYQHEQSPLEREASRR
jgi:hypothetical protein